MKALINIQPWFFLASLVAAVIISACGEARPTFPLPSATPQAEDPNPKPPTAGPVTPIIPLATVTQPASVSPTNPPTTPTTPTLEPEPEPVAAPTPSEQILESVGFTVKVTRVIDGDTFEAELPGGLVEHVRLLGVDTPEVFRRNQPGEYAGVTDTACLDQWGDRATDFALAQLDGREVVLTFDPTSPRRTTFGDLLAYVRVNAPQSPSPAGANQGQSPDFNADLVRLGFARVYTESHSNREEELLRLQAQAQSINIGLWGCRGDIEPPTATLAPVSTPVPTPILPPSPQPTPTPTATPAPTPVPTSTPVPTATPQPTLIPAPTPVPTSLPTPTPTPLPTATPTPVPTGSTCSPGQVEVNSASADELDQIINIGPTRAAEMLLIRPFVSLDDLVRINGIGPARLADIKNQGLACVAG